MSGLGGVAFYRLRLVYFTQMSPLGRWPIHTTTTHAGSNVLRRSQVVCVGTHLFYEEEITPVGILVSNVRR